jgi:hypothetical protein
MTWLLEAEGGGGSPQTSPPSRSPAAVHTQTRSKGIGEVELVIGGDDQAVPAKKPSGDGIGLPMKAMVDDCGLWNRALVLL